MKSQILQKTNKQTNRNAVHKIIKKFRQAGSLKKKNKEKNRNKTPSTL
jgi:hypothetical protein